MVSNHTFRPIKLAKEVPIKSLTEDTLKFKRVENKRRERGHSDVFYTIHPSGTVRRYNPVKSEDIPEGNGNDIKNFGAPFNTTSDYKRGIKYLYDYIERKEKRGDYR